MDFLRFFCPKQRYFDSLRLLTLDADAVATRLEKVIRIASQTEDHFLVNPIHRVELDLRLADAESALRRYEVVGGEQNSGF
jgi:hypothetical protein